MAARRTIHYYFKHAVASALGNLGRRGDQYLMRVEKDELINYYYNIYKLPEIKLIDNGIEVISEGPSRSHQKTNVAKVTIRFYVEAGDKVERALKLRLTQSSVDEDYFNIDTDGFYVIDELSPISANEQIAKHKEILLRFISAKNQEIHSGNEELKNTLTNIVEERLLKLREQEETLEQLSKIIPIKLKSKPSSPIVPLVTKKEIKINPPQPRKFIQPIIDPRILDAIIDVLIRGGRTFEVAPETFGKLDESDLRNILISFLNGNFKLHATAEAFNKLGKTDISLLYSEDNLFVAECKFWAGSRVYSETIDQLFRYLTWRENLGVIICFVREKDFTSIIEKVRNSATAHVTYFQNSLRNKLDSYFVTKHIFPEDKHKTVDVHHILFTIYSIR